MRAGTVVLLLTQLLVGCDGAGPSRAPTSPSPLPIEQPIPQPPPAVKLLSFVEASTGFTTTDLRDAQEQIVQIKLGLRAHLERRWHAPGGYRVTTLPGLNGPVDFIEGRICPEGCAFEVRFGARDGERRADPTVDYGHDNPGTLVDVEVVGGALVVTKTELYALEASPSPAS